MTDNKSLQQRRQAAVPQGIASLLSVYADRASNSEVWDVEGKRYIDFAGGIAVLNSGHLHPKVKQAVQEQLERFSHTCFQVMPYESYIELAERLNKITPGSFAKKTILFSSGAEALENAVKVARAATGREAIISFVGGFHGRTNMTLGLTGKVVPYKTGFGPFPNEIYHVPFPGGYRGPSVEESLAALDTLLKADVEPGRVAAIVIEPVQGEGGFYIAPNELMQSLRKLCDEHGILLIADEVQTGFARTGKMFAVEYSGVAPDIIAMAKSLAGGFPLSAVTGRAEVMDAAKPGGLGGTYAGNPLACAASLAVLDVIEEEGLLERSNEIGERVKGFLSEIRSSNVVPYIGDIRGLGGMVAVEFVKDKTSKEPAPDYTKAVVGKASEKGLVILSCGVHGNVVRFLMPLTISDDLLEEGLGLLKEAMVEAAEQAQAA